MSVIRRARQWVPFAGGPVSGHQQEGEQVAQVGEGYGHLPLALAVGALVRLAPLVGLDFPLGDGGMFAVMVRDIRDASFGLPHFTSYNGGDIPFAYPPLGLYLVALLPGDPLTTERWLPLVWSLLGIGAFWLLVRQVSERSAGPAAVVFALLPDAYAWQIMGGGITRALGQLLAVLALVLVARALRSPSWPVITGAGGLGGLAALTHPTEPAMIAAGSVLLWLVVSRSARGVGTLVLIAGGAAVVLLPWFAIVVGRHGLDPFLGALDSHTAVPDRWRAVAVALTAGAVVPYALVLAARWRRLFAFGLVTAALAGSLAIGFVPGSVQGVDLYAVPAGDREAMADLPPGRYAVYTGTLQEGHASEWFPALSGAISVGTYQGAEWRGDWREAVERYLTIQRCRCGGGARLWDATGG